MTISDYYVARSRIGTIFFVYMTREVAKAIKAKATANGVNKHTK